MHIPPEVWGPSFWFSLHIVSLAYPDKPTYAEKRAAKEFFSALPYVLPCPACREHFRTIIQAMPVESWLDDRTSLMEWVVAVHNRVNQRLGKPEVSMGEFLKRYAEVAARGLPIPPASPTAEIADEMLQAAFIRGATTAVGVGVAAAAVAGLLWISYKNLY